MHKLVQYGMLMVLAATAACTLLYRPEQDLTMVERDVVVREWRLLRERRERWRLRLQDMEDSGSPRERLYAYRRRVRIAARVLVMFNRKLRNHEQRIPFTRFQWRRCYRVGCRMLR